MQSREVEANTGNGEMRRATLAVGLALSVAVPALAQEVGSDDFTFEANVLVTGGDVLSCPYRVVQPITVGVTEDYGQDTRSKIYGKLRVKAVKLGADAVVLVTKGKTHMTAFSWNRREYTGRAIRYVDRKCAPSTM